MILEPPTMKLATKEKKEMQTKISQEWDQTQDILEYINAMEHTQLELEH